MVSADWSLPDWIKSYFNNRLQYVEYNRTCSSLNGIKCGVPQGSILGPLLFFIYINGLCNASNIFYFVLFADDTNLFYSHNDLSCLMNIINTEMAKLSDWFKTNKLSINVKKSKYMIFKPRERVDLTLQINSCRIDKVNQVVFLGVILDEHISWKPHISNVVRKISKSIGIIYKSSFCLSKSTLRTLYYSLIYPYLQYCVIVCGSTYPSNLNRIVLLQKRAMRVIDKDTFDGHTDPIFKGMKVLKFNDIYLFYLGKFMFLFINSLLPQSFDNYYFRINEVPNYNTRRSRLFYVPFCRTKIRQFSDLSGFCIF